MMNIIYIYFALSLFLMDGFFKCLLKRWPILKSDYPLIFHCFYLIYNISTGCFFAFLCFVNNNPPFYFVIGIIFGIVSFNVLYLSEYSKYILDKDELEPYDFGPLYLYFPTAICLFSVIFIPVLLPLYVGSLPWITTLHTIMQIMDWPIVHYVIVIGIVVPCVTLLFVNKLSRSAKRFVGLVLALFLIHGFALYGLMIGF